jgi:hypothetical protein
MFKEIPPNISISQATKHPEPVRELNSHLKIEQGGKESLASIGPQMTSNNAI